MPEAPAHEPRAAPVPPDGQKRFTVVVEGADNGELMTPGRSCASRAAAPPPEFQAVYPYMTTVQGNRFRFRGGDPKTMSENMRKLFQDRLSTPGAGLRR